MTEDEERAQVCMCGHRRDDHWKGTAMGTSIEKGNGGCAGLECHCTRFVRQPRWKLPPVFTTSTPEDLRLASRVLMSSWARHSPEMQTVANLLEMFAATAEDTYRPKGGT